MREQAAVFLNAVMYLTRIPCPRDLPYSQSHLDRAAGYFPLVGALVGAIGAAIFLAASRILPTSIAVLLSMAGTILVTGAFHEDGFADFCDGFGGGWSKERILTIMKDSRVGAFGVIGIALLLAVKFSLLYEMPARAVPLCLVAAHSLSRFFSMSYFVTIPYARDNEDGKNKPASKHLSFPSFALAALCGVLPLALFGHWMAFLVLAPLAMLQWILGSYFSKWIGGYTGDCLGAAQQISEVFLYLYLGFLLEPWKSS